MCVTHSRYPSLDLRNSALGWRQGGLEERGTHFWYAEMTSRGSSGSMRAESAVESTRSENAALGSVLALRVSFESHEARAIRRTRSMTEAA
jgi:hypothetical protein